MSLIRIMRQPAVGVLAALLTAISSTSLLAQHAPDAVRHQLTANGLSSNASPTAIHTAADDLGNRYGIWGAGPHYKVSFHDGATFVPLLGKHYPHNQPWKWSTVSARRGAVGLVTQAAKLSHEATRAEYDLGGIVEAYDLLPDGIEQTFVVTQADGAGDLVILGAISSEMTAANAEAAHQSLAFFDAAGQHLVTFGAATAIDADGRSQRMTTEHHDGQITLRLAGSWIDKARFPIVVDPIITSPHQIHTNMELIDSCDVVRASEGNTQPGWVGYATYASALDRDVFLRRIDDDSSVGAEVFADVTSTWSSQGPKLAYVASAGRTVMLFDRWFAGGNRQMRSHSHQGSDLTANSQVTQINTHEHAWRGDIGGTVVGGFGNLALAVWQAEPNNGPFQPSASSKIYGTYLNPTTGGHTAVFAIANAVQQDQERPSVNQYATGTLNNSWRVAYQTVTAGVIGGTDDWDVAIKSVDQNYNVSPPMFLDVDSPDHQFAPTIEGLGSRYAVVYLATPLAATFPTTDAGHEIRITMVNWPNTGVGTGSEPWGTNVLQSNGDARLEIAGLGFDRTSHSHWALMFHSNVTHNMYLRTVGHRGKQLRAENVFTSLGSWTMRGGVSYNHATGRFMLAHGRATAWDYVAVDQYAYPTVTPWSTSGIACSSASIGWSGKQLVGGEYETAWVHGAPAGALHLMVLATDAAARILVGLPPIVDGCWLLVPTTGPDFLGILDLRHGENVVWQIPLPEFLPSDDLYLQGFHTTGATFEFHSTQRLHVPIVK